MKCPECGKTMKYMDASHLKRNTIRNYFCASCGVSKRSVEVTADRMAELVDAERQLSILKNGITRLFSKVEV